MKTNGQEQTCQTNQQNWNEVTEPGSPEGWSETIGTLYTLCTGNVEGIRTLSGPPSRGGGGGTGTDGAGGMEWTADPRVVTVT